ncbi:hypothetical protein Tco_0755711 [Tanacetum coccineum]
MHAEKQQLGGLEVIVVFENIETASKILKDVDHGLRRWLYKLRRGDSLQRTAGRLTWINILGIPVAGWGEETFRKIAALLEKILCLHNCRLKGNQNVIYGRVQIHTMNKGLIKEDVLVKVNGKVHKVSVVEEVRDITNSEIQEVTINKQGDYKESSNKRNDNDMQIDEEVGEENGESINENGESSDDDSESNDDEGGFEPLDGDCGKTGVRPWIPAAIRVEKMKGRGFREKLKSLILSRKKCRFLTLREKREVSPSSLGGSGGERSRKKRKAIHDMGFEGVEDDLVFNQGKADEVEVSSKKKIGRRLVTKAMEEEMRRTGIEGLGEDREGTSEAYKEYYKEASENGGVFRFGGMKDGETESNRCNISKEQVKEVGEMIGVSWVLAEKEKKLEKSRDMLSEDSVAGGQS